MGQKDLVYLGEPGACLFKVGRQGQKEMATGCRRRERSRKRSGKAKKRQEKLYAGTEQSKEVRGGREERARERKKKWGTQVRKGGGRDRERDGSTQGKTGEEG